MGFVAAVPAIISLAASAVGTITSIVGAQNQAQAQSANAKYQAQVAANNQTIANQQAERATQIGQAEAQTASLQNRARTGAVVAAMAANGIDVDQGTAVDVKAGTRELGQLAAETKVSDAAQTSYGYQQQAGNFGAQSGLLTAQAGQALTAGNIASLNAGVQGAGQVAKQVTGISDNSSILGGANSGSDVPDKYQWMTGDQDYSSG